MSDTLDAVYTERNRLVAALIRVGGFPSNIIADPDAPGWWVVYAETPAGQVSWHIPQHDLPLFEGLATGPAAGGQWDGHDTEEKWRRVAALDPRVAAVATRIEEELTAVTVGWRGVFQSAHLPGTEAVSLLGLSQIDRQPAAVVVTDGGEVGAIPLPTWEGALTMEPAPGTDKEATDG